MVVSFGRCRFKLCPISVGLILQATIGGTASHFKVLCLHDRTFQFIVASKLIGFFIHNLRSYSCDLYSLFFHLWGNGGPNWRIQFSRFQEEERISWKSVQSSSTPKSYADSVKLMPLTGANLEPIGKPKISKQMQDRLSFPLQSPESSLMPALCSRCLLAGHPKVKCRQPLRCRACMGWGHIAASCRARRPIAQCFNPGGLQQRSSAFIAKPKVVAPAASGLFKAIGHDRPSSSNPPVFNSMGEFLKTFSLDPALHSAGHLRPITVPWPRRPRSPA